MGLITRALDFLGLEKRADGDLTDPSWLALAPQIGATSAVSARQAEQLSAVAACVGAISTALAYVPAVVYRRDANGNRIKVPDHPIAGMVRRGVNPRMTWPEFMEHFIASALLQGNGLASVQRNGNGRIAGLSWVPWTNVTVSELRSGRIAYDVNDGLRSFRLLEGEALHLRERTDDGIVGKSRLARANETVSGVRAVDEWARSFLANGANPSGALTADHKIDDDTYARLKTAITDKFQGSANSGRPMLLDQGLKWQEISLSPEDSELLESRKFGVVEICRLYQVPPPIIQAYENNTFTNAAQAGLWFATFCLAPWARRIETEFARVVFPANSGLELELDLSGFLRGDPETRWNAHKIALETGVLDPDEVRQIEGWNPRGTANG